MIPETAVAMLACTRIGAIHSIVFGGFSPDSLKDRILDATCNLVITSDEGMRGGRKVPMKANIDKLCSARRACRRPSWSNVPAATSPGSEAATCGITI
ncbi:MAG: hypothetical protein U1F70_04210 [Candidatus Competibacteraceae bacterium]